MDEALRRLERSLEDDESLLRYRDACAKLGAFGTPAGRSSEADAALLGYYGACARAGALPLELRTAEWAENFRLCGGGPGPFNLPGAVVCLAHGRPKHGPFSLDDVAEVYVVVEARRETLLDRLHGVAGRLKDGRFFEATVTRVDGATGPSWAGNTYPCLRKLWESGFPMTHAPRGIPLEAGCRSRLDATETPASEAAWP